MTPIFRKAIPGDAPAIARLLTEAWRQAYRGILSDALPAAIDVERRRACMLSVKKAIRGS